MGINPGSLTILVAPNDVIWKLELYFLMSERKCNDSCEVAEYNVFKGSGSCINESSFTLPLLQHIPGASSFHLRAAQYLHSLFMRPIAMHECVL